MLSENRILRKIGPLVVVSGLLVSPAFAEETSESEQRTAQTASEPEQLICRRMQITGSRRIHRYCFTQEEWMEMRDRDVADLEDLDRNGNAGDFRDHFLEPTPGGNTGPVEPSPRGATQ